MKVPSQSVVPINGPDDEQDAKDKNRLVEEVSWTFMTPEERKKHVLNDLKEQEKHLAHQFKEKSKLDKVDYYGLLFAIINRARFSYTLKDIIAYSLKCICLRGVRQQRRNATYKKHHLFEKAAKKFNEELDAVKIVKTIRKFKMLSQAMLS